MIALAAGFSGSTYAASNWYTQEGTFCETPSKQTQAITPAKGSGGELLPANVTRVTADKLAGQIQHHHRAEGNVIVERNQETLNADWIDYDQPQDTVIAGDQFTLTHADGHTVAGSTLNYHLGSGTGTAQNAAFESDKNGHRLQGVGSEVFMQEKNNFAATDVQFNTCKPHDKSWYIQAAEVVADKEKGIGVARHARLVLGGIPVLYTPWADFPLNGNRKSGLLVPTMSIGSDGTRLDAPYYLNLAPNYDATLTPGIITSRGVRLGGEFRYLQPKYSGSLKGTYMPHDARSQYDNRYALRILHNQQFNQHWSANVDVTQVSDDDYYRDFEGLADIAQNVNLDRKLTVYYNNTLLGEPFNAEFLLQNYQSLKDALGNQSKPYAILPRVTARWQKDITPNSHFNIYGQFTRFTHNTKQAGSRAVVYPSVQWNFHNDWGYIHPKIGIHATQYWLNAWNGQNARNVSRVLPIINIDSGLTLERQAHILGQDFLQTLEPRVYYNYIPRKSQNDLPNFDTSENDFTYDQLFRENIYSGNDRINASNSISIGIQTRLLSSSTGTERFRAGFGQRYYLNKDDVLLNGNISQRNRQRSDFTAFAGGWFTPNWYADSNWHWSQNDETTKRFDLGVHYNPEAGKVLSARFKYGLNEEIYNGFYSTLKHLDLAAQWPIKNNLYAVGRFNYSISPRTVLEQTLGLEYRNPCGCWSASFVAQRYVTGLNTHKNAFFFTLQLKDLSNIGNDPFEKLRLGIPSYIKTNEVNK